MLAEDASMLPREVLRQIRRLQLKARRAVEDLLGGEYHSVFKGAGMAFADVMAGMIGTAMGLASVVSREHLAWHAAFTREYVALLLERWNRS